MLGKHNRTVSETARERVELNSGKCNQAVQFFMLSNFVNFIDSSTEQS